MIISLLRLGPVLCALTLAGCGAEPVDDRVVGSDLNSLPSGATPSETGDDVVVGTELCDVLVYKGLEGTKIIPSTLPDDKNLRVFNVNDIVTRDYIPQRTNIVYDDTSTVRQVYCG